MGHPRKREADKALGPRFYRARRCVPRVKREGRHKSFTSLTLSPFLESTLVHCTLPHRATVSSYIDFTHILGTSQMGEAYMHGVFKFS